MKKTVEILFKSVIAGIISIILLSIFSLIYYNPPVATQQSDLVTNFKFKENSNWSYMIEGFGFGTTDELGYNNAYYTDCSEPDIVFVGSSHLEALQVPQKDNCVYLLNEKFDKDNLPYNDFKCLNLGVSANAFEVSVSNFPYITDKYKDAKYIVIETYNVEFSSAMLDEIAGRAIWIYEPVWGVTTNLHVKFRKPVPYGVKLKAVGEIIKNTTRAFIGLSKLYDMEGNLLAEAEATYLKLSLDKIASSEGNHDDVNVYIPDDVLELDI